MVYDDCVRCGNLAASTVRHDPRVCLGGAAWSSVLYSLSDCPAKGQPLLSTSGGFSLADSEVDDSARIVAAAGSSSLMGFGVMRSPDRSHSPMAEGSQGKRGLIDLPFAPMLRLRKTEKLS